MAPTETRKATKIVDPIRNPTQATGRKNCKKRDLELSNHSCPNSRNPSQTAFPRSPNGMMTPLQACLHQSWVVVILKRETKVVGLNDCQLVPFIPLPGSQTQIPVLVLHHSHDRELKQPMKLIPMPMLVALVPTSSSSSTPPGVSMSMPAMSPSSLFQMCRLCPARPPGMIQLLRRPTFWSQMKPFAMARNWITPLSTPTKFKVLGSIVGMILLTNPGPCLSGLLTVV